MLIQSIGDLQSTANELNYELQGLEEEQSGGLSAFQIFACVA